MGHFGRILTFIRSLWGRLGRLTDWFALKVAAISALPFWIPALMFGSFLGLALGRNDAVMVILTIQTSIDAQATKTLQSHLRSIDEKRDRILQENVESVRELVIEVKAMADTLIDLAMAAERRDKLGAKRDRMILTALEARADFYDFMRRGGDVFSHDSARKTARRAGKPRKAHGRANSARS